MTSTLPKAVASKQRTAAELQTELDRRGAELAVVNEVGAALAQGLHFQSVVEAVGDRVSEILDSRDLSIAILDPTTNLISFPYWMENGIRDLNTPPLTLGEGLRSRIPFSIQ